VNNSVKLLVPFLWLFLGGMAMAQPAPGDSSLSSAPPKSWLYVALNDQSAREDPQPSAFNPIYYAGPVRSQYFIGAIKAKYLLYF
jgi:hypothetical protein